jgi:hypothetical protein
MQQFDVLSEKTKGGERRREKENEREEARQEGTTLRWASNNI